MSSTLRSVSTTAAYCGLAALAAFLVLLYATSSPVTYGQASSESSASSGMSTSMSMTSMSSMSGMSSSWSMSAMSEHSASAMSQMSAHSAMFHSGWPGVFPEITGFTRSFFEPYVASMPRGFPYWQRATYQWTGGADKVLEVTAGRGPDLRRMALRDLRRRSGLAHVRVGNYRGWLWENRSSQGSGVLHGKLVLVLGGNKLFVMEAYGQGPWENLTDLVKRFDLSYTARALASPPQISRQ